MREFVVDASAALAWLVQTQATSRSAAFLAERDQDRLLAPYIFSWEVGNVLLSLHRRRALSTGAHGAVLVELAALEVDVQPAPPRRDVEDLAAFARVSRFSLFDAAYVKLAIERGAELVSRDAEMLAIATEQGVPCIDLRGPVT